MRSSQVSVGDNILASQYNFLRNDAVGGAFLLPHEQSVPDLTLKVESGVCYVGAVRVIYAGGNSPSFTAPSSNPRIDLLTIDSSGALARTAGSEAGSPTVPTYPNDKLVIAEVYCRVGQTTIRDTDQGSNGYIKQDVRPFLGGAFIASNDQVSASAAIQPSKLDAGNVDTDWIPDTDDARKLGSSSKQWSEIRAKKVYQDNALLASAKFGGSGSDGALTITSGTTNIDCAGAAIVIKNYTSISITGTGALTFSNPNSNGTTVILRSQGNVTLTSSATPMIDMSGMGGSGGAAVTSSGSVASGNSGSDGITFKITTKAGTGSSRSGPTNGVGGAAVSAYTIANLFTQTIDLLMRYGDYIFIGAGGGSGSVSNATPATSGGGGKGGGCLVIECGGAWNFTTTNGISVAGKNATAATGTHSCGGGGGAGGSFLALYNTLTANSGTVTVSGGSGSSGSGSLDGNDLGAGGGGSFTNAGQNGQGSASGGSAGAGLSTVLSNNQFS